MNQYMALSTSGKHYGPFKDANAAAKWANKFLRGNYNLPTNFSILRLFAPK